MNPYNRPARLTPINDSGESDNASRAAPAGSGVSTPYSMTRKQARSPVSHRGDSSSADSLAMADFVLPRQVTLVPRTTAPSAATPPLYPVDTQAGSHQYQQQPTAGYWKPPQYAYADTQPQQRQDQWNPQSTSYPPREPTTYPDATESRGDAPPPRSPYSTRSPAADTTSHNPYQATSDYPPPPKRTQPGVYRPPYPDQRLNDVPYPVAEQFAQQTQTQGRRDSAFSAQSPQSPRSPKFSGFDRLDDRRFDRYDDDDSRRSSYDAPPPKPRDGRRDSAPARPGNDSRLSSQPASTASQFSAPSAQSPVPSRSDGRRSSQPPPSFPQYPSQSTQSPPPPESRRQSEGDQYRRRPLQYLTSETPRDRRDDRKDPVYPTSPDDGEPWTMSIPERTRQPYRRSGSRAGGSDDVSTVSSDRTVRQPTARRDAEAVSSTSSDPRAQIREDRRRRYSNREKTTANYERTRLERQSEEDESHRLDQLRAWRSSVMKQRKPSARDLDAGLQRELEDSRKSTGDRKGWGKEYGWSQDRASERYRSERKGLVRRFEDNFEPSVSSVYNEFKSKPERGVPSDFITTGPKVRVEWRKDGADVVSSYTFTVGGKAFTESSKQFFQDRR